jgi:hypothetical protein
MEVITGSMRGGSGRRCAPADGRRYAGPDDDMKVIWDAGVAEARQAIEVGWVA